MKCGLGNKVSVAVECRYTQQTVHLIGVHVDIQ